MEKGELYVVPKGSEHKPYAENECKILMIEPMETINTGNEVSEKTKEGHWI